MIPPIDAARQKVLAAAFNMPTIQTMMSRKTSITNAFVCAVIPILRPSYAEIHEALTILEMDAGDPRCAYCGDPASEWDHLRPLVVNRRPTGFISEIANLVPSCSKCNQSKGNWPWRDWIINKKAKRSPSGRGVEGTADRTLRLEAYERWRSPTKIDFESILGTETWEHYWSLCERVVDELRESQRIADGLRERIISHLGGDHK